MSYFCDFLLAAKRWPATFLDIATMHGIPIYLGQGRFIVNNRLNKISTCCWYDLSRLESARAMPILADFSKF